MGISDYFLYIISKNVASPQKGLHESLNYKNISSHEYAKRYAQNQFNYCVKNGIKINVTNKDVLEIGCGHGGISCYLASVGAKSVIGIDINERNLEFAEKLKKSRFDQSGTFQIPLKFMFQNATNTDFGDESFDIIFAPNSFEHFDDPAAVMKESFRILRSEGILVVDPFSSIYCKYAAHIKHGVTIPWVNLFFSDKTIIKALYRASIDDPNIFVLYPGLKGNPKTIRDIRKHRDLNNITFSSFKKMALSIGFIIDSFQPNTRGYIGRIARKIPIIRNSVIIDVLSQSATSIIRKP